jgi:hypothetical protein
MSTKSPLVERRIGIDLHINHLDRVEDYLWLKALIWPEHHDRRSHFEKAASYLQTQPVEFIQGDGVTLLPALAATVSRDTALCIFHTHVANQMSDEAKKTLNNHIQGLCEAGRDVFHLYNNMQDFDLHLDYHLDGNMVHETLATTDGHGRWFEWKVLHDHI